MKVRGKRLTLLAGSCAVLLSAAAFAVYHEEIATAFYLELMERDPALVVDYLERESPSAARAVEEFSRTEEGQRALLDAFLSGVAEVEPRCATSLRIAMYTVFWIGDDGNLNFGVPGPCNKQYRELLEDLALADRLRKIQDMLGETRARDLQSSEFPGVKFSFQSLIQAITFPRPDSDQDRVVAGSRAGQESLPRYVCSGMRTDLPRHRPMATGVTRGRSP